MSKFNMIAWLQARGFSSSEEDRRVFTNKEGAMVKIYMLDNVRYMSVWDKFGNRMMSVVQPKDPKLMSQVMGLSRVIPLGQKYRLKTSQNEIPNKYKPITKKRYE